MSIPSDPDSSQTSNQDLDIESYAEQLKLANNITKINKESFVGAFNDWYEKYKDIVNERVQDKRIKRKTPPYMRPGFVAPTLV